MAAANGQPSSRVIGERIGSIKLPRGMRLQFVEFPTNTHGYAHYISDAPESGGYRSLAAQARHGPPDVGAGLIFAGRGGCGMLVSSSGQAGAAFAGDVWTPVELTPRPDWIHTLRGGTVVATSITHATLYLGTRTGREIRWVRVVLKQS